MSSAAVRAGLVAYFKAQNIAGLNKVHSAPPFWADGSEWNLAANLGSGAVAAVHLTSDAESRISVPALTGTKIVHYRVGLMLFYQWLKPSAQLTPVDEAAWADPLDVIVDGVKAALRADPNCGIPSVIWQSAQDANDVVVQRDIPRQLPGKVVSWNVVEFNVYEVINS